MSGITGWTAHQRDLTQQQQVIEEMSATMARRGPDTSGLWTSRRAALAHRGLSLSPGTPAAEQPMLSDPAAEQAVAALDGEIYNAVELRSELRRRGHTFRTESDTEVALRGYLEWGTAVAEQLQGMYGIAVWDARQERLVLIRDRMGIKPLYYYATDDGVLFGSEPKAVLANPLVDPVVDGDGLREIFNRFLKTPGQAVWAGMREVIPGHVVTVDGGGLREQPYWQLTAQRHTDDLPTTIEKVRGLLYDIMPRQVRADVQLCVLLSGGLDSSSLTGLSKELLGGDGKRVSTFSVDFVGQAEHFKSQPELGRPSRDAPYVRDVAAHMSTDHHDVVLDHLAVLNPEVRRACIEARDIPIGLGDRDHSVYVLLQAVRELSPLALSGDGSDAVFGSYSFQDVRAGDGSDTPGLLSFPFYDTGLLSAEFLETIGHAEHIRTRYRESIAKAPLVEDETEAERRMRLSCYLDLMCMVPPTLADRKDRYGMAAGVEVRVPYYDHRLVEYVYNVPPDMKNFDGREKSLLRAVTKGLLPESVVQRRKSGYPSPHNPLHVAGLQAQVRELLASDHGSLAIYDRELVEQAVGAPPATVDNAQRCGMERLLDMSVWMDARKPTLKIGG